MKQNNHGWFLLFMLTSMTAIFMGIVLVWLSIERTDKAYSMRQMRMTLEQSLALKGKLEVERERLLTPVELSRHAERLGIHEAKMGQIRHLPNPTNNTFRQ